MNWRVAFGGAGVNSARSNSWKIHIAGSPAFLLRGPGSLSVSLSGIGSGIMGEREPVEK